MAHGFLNGARYSENEMSLAQFIERTITEYDIPEGVTRLAEYCFCYCRALKRVSFPESVTSIGANALRFTAVTEVELPIGCTALESYSFYEAKALKSIKLGDVATVRNNSFDKCASCEIYDFSRCSSVPNLTDVSAFGSINAQARIFVPPSLYEEWIEATNWSQFAPYIVPIGRYGIPSQGLDISTDDWGIKVLTGRGSCTDSVIVIPEGVADFSWKAFVGDEIVTKVYMPDTITQMGDYAFGGCPNLTEIYMPGVWEVSSFEFPNLPSLEYVRFGRNIRHINGGCFTESSNVLYDFSDAESIPTIEIEGYDRQLFGENPTFKVPAELYDEWINDTNWTLFKEHIAI